MTEPARAGLPLDGEAIVKLAARSMFELFSDMAQGMMLVDRDGRVVWINEAYKKFLPALGFERAEDFVGRPVEEVVPNTLMRHVIESGKPILVDLLSNKAGTFVVSRIPLRDEAGRVIGALGMVLFDHPETTLQPLIAKFATLQRDLDEARKALAAQRRTKYTLASFIGSSPAVLEVKRQARRAAQSGATVLLLGETGTGKELLAHAIHAGSLRARAPLHQREPRSGARDAARSRVLRRGAGCVHRRRSQRPRREVPPRRRRDALSRRDRRHAARPAGKAAARPAGAGVRTAGLEPGHQGGRARDRRHQPRSAQARGRRALPRGPLLPPERAADPPADVA